MPTTANNETLERIKDEVAKSLGYATYQELIEMRNPHWNAEATILIAKRYAFVCIEASLKEAAENAKITPWLISSTEYGATVNKESITDEKNIKLL